MARFSKDIELKYGIKTYEETKKTYEWIEKSAKKWGREEANISIKFLLQSSHKNSLVPKLFGFASSVKSINISLSLSQHSHIFLLSSNTLIICHHQLL